MIKLDTITKKYKDKTILQDLNFQIRQKTGVVSLIGPNGAGKSTLLRILSGILLPNSGYITIPDGSNDVILTDFDLRNKVAFISASERMLHYKLSVKDNIIYYNVLKGMTIKEIMGRYYKVVKDINLVDFENRLVETLSTGEKKKVLIACALCSSCDVVILDEPTIGLDYDAKLDLKEILQDYNIINNKLFIVSSHDFDFLGNLSEENIFLFDGKISTIVNDKLPIEVLTEIYNGRGGENNKVF